jgi:serine/threonine protein kinase/Tfp pilus assembly protein PilF
MTNGSLGNNALDRLIGDLADDFLRRQELGERPDPEEYAAGHPDAADEIRRALEPFRMFAAAPESGPAPEPQADRNGPDVSGVLGDYRIVREVGRGGMGVVYEAEQLSLGRRVALKVLPFAALSDSRLLARFKNEARAAAALDHPHIVKVHAVGQERGTHFLAMQFIDGRPLSDLIRERQTGAAPTGPRPASPDAPTETQAAADSVPASAPVPRASATPTRGDAAYFRQVATWGVQAAEALEHAHSMGVVHRDVKPGNLLLDGSGNVWVADFGLAKLAAAETGVTATGDVLGTLRYMAPEQALSKHDLVDHRADVYALGATLYELLMGVPAVDGTDKADTLRKITAEDPVAPRKLDRGIPADLETVVLKCLAKDPAERYATAAELADDLRRFLTHEPVRAKRPTLGKRVGKWARRHPAWAAVTVAALVAGTGAMLVWGREQSRAEAAAREVAAEADGLRRRGRPQEARAVIHRAADLLPRFADPRLREQIARSMADLDLLVQLDAVRDQNGDWSLTDLGKPFRRPDLLRAYGVSFDEADEPQVTAALRGSTIRDELAALLDEFATDGYPHGGQLVERLAVATDDDDRQLLTRARWAARAHNREALRQLAMEAMADLPSPPILERLAAYLQQDSAWEEAVRLLRIAQARHPDDGVVNARLTHTLYQSKSHPPSEIVPFCRAAVALRPQSPTMWMNLGVVLAEGGSNEDAELAFRRLIELDPGFNEAQFRLGLALAAQAKWEQAERAFQAAADREKDRDLRWLAHFHVAETRRRQGKEGDEAAAYRRALEATDDGVDRLTLFSLWLSSQKRATEAEEEARRAITLRPDWTECSYALAHALANQGRLEEAGVAADRAVALGLQEAACGSTRRFMVHGMRWDARYFVNMRLRAFQGDLLFEQVRLAEAEESFRKLLGSESFRRILGGGDPQSAAVVCQFGRVLRARGKFRQSLDMFRRGHELLSRMPPHQQLPTTEWVREAEHLAELEARLPALLSGEARPGSAEDQADVAHVCLLKGYPTAAARFYEAAFEIRPGLAYMPNSHRYNAACAAVRAAAGQGDDAQTLSGPVRARLRHQAHAWLNAELGAWQDQARSPGGPSKVAPRMRHWQRDPGLAGIRDPAAVARLPDSERRDWERLWAEVAALTAPAPSATPPAEPGPAPRETGQP